MNEQQVCVDWLSDRVMGSGVIRCTHFTLQARQMVRSCYAFSDCHAFCFCVDCKDGNFNQCELRTRYGSEMPVRINPKVVSAVAVTRATTTLEDLAKRSIISAPSEVQVELTKNAIALRESIPDLDPNEDNEHCYLGRVIGAAKVLQADGVYSGNL